MLQKATPLRKSAPGPPSISDEHVSCLYCACQGKFILADPLQTSHACHRFWRCYTTFTFCSFSTRCAIPCAYHAKRHLNPQKWSEHVVLLTCLLRNVLRATTARAFSTSQLPKVVRTCGVFNVFAVFLLRNALRATTACTFSTSQILKAVRSRGVLYILNIATSKSAPELRCFVHFHLENALRATTACNFSSLIWPAGSAPAPLASLLLHPPEPQITGKHHVSRLSYLFARLDLLPSSPLFSDSSHHCLSYLFILLEV